MLKESVLARDSSREIVKNVACFPIRQRCNCVLVHITLLLVA